MKIGLITYHSAYNFGSVLQAYATQETIKKIGGNCEIIDYRSKEQKRVYSIFKWDKDKFFLKSLVKNILAIFNYSAKKKRQIKYETLFEKIFNLSELCIEPNDVYKIWNKYDIIISGSDQIWNKHSNELENVSWEYMNPYLLNGYNGIKVSYASSLTNMTDDEINKIYPSLKSFNAISIREYETSNKLNQTFDLKTINVLDPTFLLKKEEWIKKFDLKKDNAEKYILYYVLCKRKDITKSIEKIKKIAQQKKLKVKMIAPLSFIKNDPEIDVLCDIDPVDFLNLIYNAESVITDSYHGTILSVNLGIDVYSVCKGNPSDFRKIDILNRIGMKDRIIDDISKIIEKNYSSIDYEIVNKNLNLLRDNSIQYLRNNLKENY